MSSGVVTVVKFLSVSVKFNRFACTNEKLYNCFYTSLRPHASK